MQRIANWTNLTETTFVLPPTTQAADLPRPDLHPRRGAPFAGHPTLGTCHAWLAAGGTPARDGVVVQECGAGLITIKNDKERLAFSAPPLDVSGPVEEAVVARARAQRPGPAASPPGSRTASGTPGLVQDHYDLVLGERGTTRRGSLPLLDQPGMVGRGHAPLRVQAAEVFAADAAAGRVPSIRAIRSRLRVGQPRAQQVRAYLAALAGG